MFKTMITDMPIQRGPNLTEQEWNETLRLYQEAKAEELKTISPDDDRYADIERAARGLFWHSDVIARVQ